MTYNNLPGQDTLFGTITTIYNWFFAFSVMILVLVVLYAGFTFLTSGGDPQKLAKAKSILLWAVIGFVIILLAQGISTTIENIFGM
ncbi:MAG: hypothetical protein HYW95_02325 [Candidatus Wildermuthbacteria bacterium]|nr:hypothetical protein [Candidatus Wildermuthbacteria bacterium]